MEAAGRAQSSWLARPLLDSRRAPALQFSVREMHVRRSHLIASVALLAGCVEGFNGSDVQIDLNPRTPPQAPASRAPGPGELASNIHFTLYAIKEAGGADSLFELQRFEVHKVVDPTSPCFIDAGPNVPFPGLHVTRFFDKTAEQTGITDLANPPPGATMEQRIRAATAAQRRTLVDALGGDAGLKAVTSASAGGYPPVDATCTGTGLPPPSCIDDASNARRLRICRQAWADDPLLFEGTDRVLTAPLNGTTFGFVVGKHPLTTTDVGGAHFVVEDALVGVDEYAIYFQTDGVAGPGTLFLEGRPTQPTRGVSHVHLESPFLPQLVEAELAVFANLGEDDVHF